MVKSAACAEVALEERDGVVAAVSSKKVRMKVSITTTQQTVTTTKLVNNNQHSPQQGSRRP